MESVGSKLRGRREADGISVEEIGGRLCIGSSYVRALEADEVNGLPGTFFYKSFALQYAGILGMDAESLRAEIDSLCRQEEPANPLGASVALQMAQEPRWRRFVFGM